MAAANDTGLNYYRVLPKVMSIDQFTGDTIRILGPDVLMDKQHRIISLNCDSGMVFKIVKITFKFPFTQVEPACLQPNTQAIYAWQQANLLCDKLLQYWQKPG